MVLRTRRLWSRIAEDFKALAENKSPRQGTLRGTGEGALPNRPFQTAAGSCLLRRQLAANITARGGEIKGLRLQDAGLTRPSPFAVPSTKTDAGRGSFPSMGWHVGQSPDCWNGPRRSAQRSQGITCCRPAVTATPKRARVLSCRIERSECWKPRSASQEQLYF